MKKYLVFAVAALSMSSCSHTELDRSNQQNDSLQSVVSDRDSSLNEFIASFNDVERNLDSVAIRQHVIAVNSDQSGELKQNQKTRINAEIAAINKLMDENRKKLAQLSSKLKKSGNKNVELEKTIATMTDQLTQKDVELTALNEKLNNLNAQVVQLQTSVTSLTAETNSKTETINQETTALHTAYYVVGKSKDLQKSKLIDRKGGLLGMGKRSEVNANFDNSKFTRIDYTQTTTIAINSDDVKIISTHPGGTFTLDKDPKNPKIVKNIIITDPEKFWSVSKYLVVVND